MEAINEYLADKDLVAIAINLGLKLLAVLAIWIIGRWIGRRLQNALERLLRKRDVDDVLVDFLGTIARTLVMVVVIIAILDQVGIPPASVLAVVGAAGLAVGLAMKDSLSNFAAGVMLVLFRPFTKGDFIDVGGTTGTADEITLVSTTLVTPDNKLVTVPNSVVWGNTITNYSAKDTRRIDMVFGVGYDDDLKLTADVLARVCAEHDQVLGDPATKIFVTNLGDSSVDFAVRPWVKTDDYWTVRSEIMERAKVELEAAGLSIPYPQRDVHTYVHNMEDNGDD